MRIRSFLAAAKIGFALLLVQGLAAEAAEVKVIAGVASRPVLEELGPKFERATGHKLVIWYGNVTTIRRRMEAGEAFDLAVFGPTSLEKYTRQGKIAADTHTPIARVGVGVAARAGAPSPTSVRSTRSSVRCSMRSRSLMYQKAGPASTSSGC